MRFSARATRLAKQDFLKENVSFSEPSEARFSERKCELMRTERSEMTEGHFWYMSRNSSKLTTSTPFSLAFFILELSTSPDFLA
jgi:hypothetical protein